MSNVDRIRYAESSAISSPSDRGRHFTTDGLMTFDANPGINQFTIDSSGAFLIGELERLDQTMHPPLASVTWPRDIDLREDVQLGDEISSFTLSTFASPGGVTPAGISWISKEANAIPGVTIDIGKITNPLTLWGKELKYTVAELASAARTGRPLDAQLYDGMLLAHQMDIDQVVYIGDAGLGRFGLTNSPLVTVTNASTVSAVTTWTGGTKGPDDILKDVNNLLTAAWTAAGLAKVPTELRLPPVQFGYIASQKVSTAGNMSILEYVRNNSISNAANGRPLNIQPVKWLTGRGGSGKDRMFAYTRDRDLVRFPMVPLQRTPVEFRSIWQIVTYYCRLGVTEIVYPETLYYMDGI